MWLFDPSSPCIAILKFNALHKAFKARGKSSFPAGVWQPTTASTQLTTWMVRSGLAKPMAESIAGQDFQEKRQNALDDYYRFVCPVVAWNGEQLHTRGLDSPAPRPCSYRADL
jgi:hypothetical protein